MKVIYELQERCAHGAEELFKADYGKRISDTEKGQIVSDFENHYNSKLNKCFILETSTAYEKDGKIYRFMYLVDVNEHKEYGAFDGLRCTVNETSCHSRDEFLGLAKRYMQD